MCHATAIGGRKIYIFLLFLLVIPIKNFSQVQDSAIGILRKEVTNFLQMEGILLKEEEKIFTGDRKTDQQIKLRIDNDTKLKNKIFTESFLPPYNCNNTPVIPQLIFLNKPLSRIGSYIVKKETTTQSWNYAIFNSSQSPDLEIFSSDNQVSIPDPINDNSTYILNYTSKKLFDFSTDLQGSASFLAYFNTKNELQKKITNDKRHQISIAAGHFYNRLGTLFNRVINDDAIEPYEFEPLYTTWKMYARNKINNGDMILRGFDGMCFFVEQGVSTTDFEDFKSDANLSVKYGFLNVSSNVAGDWNVNNTRTVKNKAYSIYMFHTPDLVGIPDVDRIKKKWEQLQLDKKVETPNDITLKKNTPLYVKVKFGPVNNPLELQSLKLDLGYSKNALSRIGKNFIDNIILNTTDNSKYSILQSHPGYYEFTLEINRNDTFFEKTPPLNEYDVSATLPIKIYFDNIVNKDTLQQLYSVKLRSDYMPYPRFLSSNELKHTNSNDTLYYESNMQFITTDISEIVRTNPAPPKIYAIYYDNDSIQNLLNENDFSDNINFTPISDNNFKISARFPSSQSTLLSSIKGRSIDLILLFFTANGRYYRRLTIKFSDNK